MSEIWTSQQIQAFTSFGHNILVSAGAGSGKTAVLSQRVYYNVGKRHIDIDRMLVLTFTNKAAAEMKGRIRKKIETDPEHLFSSLEEKRKQLRKIDSSYIMTFDAYAFFLMKKYHLLLNKDKNLKIIDPNILAITTDELLDEIFLQHYRDKDPGFLKLISDFCIRDDRKIRKTVVKLNQKLEMLYDRNDYVHSYEMNHHGPEWENEWIERYTAILKEDIELLHHRIYEFSEYVEDTDLYFPNTQALFESSAYEEIRKNLANCEPTGKRLPKDSGGSEVKKQIGELLKKLKEKTADSLEEIREQLREGLIYENVLLQLAQELEEKLDIYKSEHNMYAFIDIFKMAISLIEENREIKEEIRNHFQEILIDEYQDTNDLQDLLIQKIENDNVYMVGDMKQSIYRFRNANPDLFMEKYESYGMSDKDERIELPNNFRSRKEIIEDINVLFDRTMDLKIGGADYRKNHHMLAKDTEVYDKQDNHLEIYSYSIDKEEEKQKDFSKTEIEAFMMAKDILEKKDHFLVKDGDQTRSAQYKDFCIIVDRTNSFDLYKQILTYFNIPSLIERDEKMNDSDLITVIRAIFSLLEKIKEQVFDNEFILDYLSLGRSFLFEMKDSELFAIVKNQNYSQSDLYRKLETIACQIDHLSIAQILDHILKEFSVYEQLIKIPSLHENLVKIDYLYQLCHDLNRSGYDFHMFNDYLKQVFEEGDNDITYNIDKGQEDAVRIINIHKAKGLQYKICYFPGLDVRFNESDKKERLTFDSSLGVITPVMIENRGLKDTIRKELFNHDYQAKDIGEKIRLLYVALTRAEEKAILLCPLQDKSESLDSKKTVADAIRLNYSCFKDLLDSIYTDLRDKQFIKEKALEELPLSKDYLYPKESIIPVANHPALHRIEIPETEIYEPEEIRQSGFSKKAGLITPEMLQVMDLGSRLHYYLETLDFSAPDYSQIEEKYRDRIRSFLNSEIMKEARSGKAYKEYEFIYEEDGNRKHGFIDLLMEYEDHFDIIDYKTKNIDDIHYDEQLNGYRRYIQSISSKKVNCYLYSIFEGRFREVKE